MATLSPVPEIEEASQPLKTPDYDARASGSVDYSAPPPYPEPQTRFTEEITDKHREYTMALLSTPISSKDEYTKRTKLLNRRHKMVPRKSTIIKVAKSLNLLIPQYLVKKIHKSTSGVAVISVMTTAADFSCKYDCYMCPKYPNYPRSYVPGEPTSQRASRFGFDAALQLLDRCRALHDNGHPVDKLEIIILGGTWSSYPDEYQERFVRDIYYAANVFYEWLKSTPSAPVRRRFSLEDEIYINQTESKCHIIGMTPETRPDCVNPREITKFRRFGFTRVQLGVQHTDDTILKNINRMAKTKHTIRGIRLLKEAGFKVDIHLMFNLLGSTPELDLAMVEEVIYTPHYQADHWKLYPTSITPYTEFERLEKEGIYVPYEDHHLIEILLKILPQIPHYIRVNRIFRDIPSHEIIGATNLPNLRQILDRECSTRKIQQRDIRAREVKDRPFDPARDRPKFYYERYPASEGEEVFISYENHDQTILYGFVRLRFNNPSTTATHKIRVLRQAAIIRELHVYGSLIKVTQSDTTDTATQHRGIGQELIRRAEQLATTEGFTKMAIIAGVGVRSYYEEKLHYTLQDTYMMKDLTRQPEPEPESTQPQNLPTIDDVDWVYLRDLVFLIMILCIFYNLIYDAIYPTNGKS